MAPVVAGIDIGSAFAKGVVIKDEKFLSYAVTPIKGNFSNSASEVLNKTLEKARLSYNDIDIIGGTGLGSYFIPVPFEKSTEINCQSKGVHYLLPEAETVIELGHQASRVIKISKGGKVADFATNDKCAIGSGRILKTISRVLNISFQQLSELPLDDANPVSFSTGCPVFLETEAISRVAEESRLEDIVAGIHQTIAIKVHSMIEKIHVEGKCAITGGGARELGLVKMIEKKIQKEILVLNEPFITGAIGAAMRAAEKKLVDKIYKV